MGTAGDKRAILGQTGITDLKGLQKYDTQFNLTKYGIAGVGGTQLGSDGEVPYAQAWDKSRQKPLALT